jgi:hypothetical protein
LTIGYILWAFDSFVVIWYIIPRFGTLHQEWSGNPEPFSKLKAGPVQEK